LADILVEKELQQLVQTTEASACDMQECSGEATVPAFDVVIRVHTPTTDADVDGCSRRVRQARAIDVVKRAHGRSCAYLATNV